MEKISKDSKDSKNSIEKLSMIKSPLFKIVLVGDSEVGKTSIINTFLVKNKFDLKKY
jgi:GTPase SAR1 family protein